jgi:hypothetical protein
MLGYTAEPHSDHIVRCILTQTNEHAGTKDKLGNLHGTNKESAGELQVSVTRDWKEGNAKEIHGPVTNAKMEL